jgi:polysaccharide pyruvyl transferase WcaK-like protein
VVFGLETPAPAPRPPSARLRVAINLFPHHDPRFWPGAEPARYRRYLGEMAAVVAWLAAEGHSVRLFPTHLRADPRCAADLRAVLASVAPGAAGAVVEADVRDVAGVVAEVAAADLVVAMRFHGILFSLLAGTPLIALSNHPKMDHLMRDHGQGDRVLSADTFTADDLARRLTTLAADRHGVSAAIRERTAEFRRRVTAQFDALFGAVAAPDPAALAGLARER